MHVVLFVFLGGGGLVELEGVRACQKHSFKREGAPKNINESTSSNSSTEKRNFTYRRKTFV